MPNPNRKKRDLDGIYDGIYDGGGILRVCTDWEWARAALVAVYGSMPSVGGGIFLLVRAVAGVPGEEAPSMGMTTDGASCRRAGRRAVPVPMPAAVIGGVPNAPRGGCGFARVLLLSAPARSNRRLLCPGQHLCCNKGHHRRLVAKRKITSAPMETYISMNPHSCTPFAPPVSVATLG